MGSVVAALFGAGAYLLKRLIDQNDAFQEQTRASIRSIRREFRDQDRRRETDKKEIKQKIEESGFDTHTKQRLTTLATNFAKLEIRFDELKPTIEKTNQNHGAIILIEEKQKAQDKMLQGLYDIVKKTIVKN